MLAVAVAQPLRGAALALAVWELVARQHGVVARWQLLALGMTPDAIRQRVKTGRLWPLWRGVYAVGRRGVTRHGGWMAAALACGKEAALCDGAGLGLFGVREQVGPTHVSVPLECNPRGRRLLVVHRRSDEVMSLATERFGIPVLPLVQCLLDAAPRMTGAELDRAINEADRLDLVRADDLHRALDDHRGAPGVRSLRTALDERTFFLNRSTLERLFGPIARRAGLPKPLTRVEVNGFEVDFWWPELRLVIETDGLRYRRTPAQQAKDRRRDQAHMAAGDYPLRFTHAQVKFGAPYVERIVTTVARRLRSGID